jgi:hypothetical protein
MSIVAFEVSLHFVIHHSTFRSFLFSNSVSPILNSLLLFFFSHILSHFLLLSFHLLTCRERVSINGWLSMADIDWSLYKLVQMPWSLCLIHKLYPHCKWANWWIIIIMVDTSFIASVRQGNKCLITYSFSEWVSLSISIDALISWSSC